MGRRARRQTQCCEMNHARTVPARKSLAKTARAGPGKLPDRPWHSVRRRDGTFLTILPQSSSQEETEDSLSEPPLSKPLKRTTRKLWERSLPWGVDSAMAKSES